MRSALAPMSVRPGIRLTAGFCGAFFSGVRWRHATSKTAIMIDDVIAPKRFMATSVGLFVLSLDLVTAPSTACTTIGVQCNSSSRRVRLLPGNGPRFGLLAVVGLRGAASNPSLGRRRRGPGSFDKQRQRQE